MSQQASFNPPLRARMHDGYIHLVYAVDGKDWLTQAADQTVYSQPQWHPDWTVKELLDKPANYNVPDLTKVSGGRL